MHEQALTLGSRERSEHWITVELRDVWRAAQAQADEAYWHWRYHPGAAAYAVYRAAQDRADAAQEHLAQWVDPSLGR